MNFEMLRRLRIRAPILVTRVVRQSVARAVNAIVSAGRDYEADIEAMRAMSEHWKRSSERAATALIEVQRERERLVAEIADLRSARAEFEEGHQQVVRQLAECANRRKCLAKEVADKTDSVLGLEANSKRLVRQILIGNEAFSKIQDEFKEDSSVFLDATANQRALERIKAVLKGLAQ